MQFKIYNRQDMSLVDTGAVAAYKIDDDYLIMNSSTISLVAETKAVQGGIIALIKTSGAYKLGCITAVDNKALTITFKDLKELFNDNMLNPLRNDGTVYKYECIAGIAALLDEYATSSDYYKRISIRTQKSGKYEWAVWDYTGNTLNTKQYLIDCFDRYNIVLKFRIDFADAKSALVIDIFNNTNSGTLIKDNVKLQTLTFSEAQNYENTTAVVIEKETKQELYRYYLLTDGKITSDINHTDRALPVKTAVVEWDSSMSGENPVTALEAAESVLKGKEYNHYIESQVNRDNYIIDIASLSVGDAVTVITAPVVEPVNETDPTYSQTDTIFTGMKETNTSNMVTLVFGKARKLYTDKMQLQLRRGGL